MPVAKKTDKISTVHVETKKMHDDCCSLKTGCTSPCKWGHLLIIVLLLVNTILSIVAITSSSKMEAMKVGGRENYQLVQKIYGSKMFQTQQKQQIEQALQMYQGTTNPTVAPSQAQVEVPTQMQQAPAKTK